MAHQTDDRQAFAARGRTRALCCALPQRWHRPMPSAQVGTAGACWRHLASGSRRANSFLTTA